MKLNLLFVFFLALPVVGHLLNNDSNSASEVCSDRCEPVSTTQTAPATPAAKPAPAPSAAKPAATATSGARPAKSSGARAAAVRALNFM